MDSNLYKIPCVLPSKRSTCSSNLHSASYGIQNLEIDFDILRASLKLKSQLKLRNSKF